MSVYCSVFTSTIDFIISIPNSSYHAEFWRDKKDKSILHLYLPMLSLDYTILWWGSSHSCGEY